MEDPAPRGENPIGTRVVFEDDYCRVWLLRLEAGQDSGWHTHESDYVYVVTKAQPARTEYEDGSAEEQRDSVGASSLRGRGGAHRLINLGTSDYRNIIIELKDAPQ